MGKRVSIVAGAALITVGMLALVISVAGVFFGFRMWQLWPVFVIGAGLAFVIPPLLVRGHRGLGGLFIPGMPVLANGCILLFTSVTRWWGAWEWLWPVEVLSVAAGFVFAAIKMRVKWLLIPAAFLAANGLLFQFCALTGWWAVWAVAWVIEPLSIGLALLGINLTQRSSGLAIAGVALCVLAVVGAMQSIFIVAVSTLFPVWWMWKWMAPVALILTGSAILVYGLTRRFPAPKLAGS
jgi:hypothetical protein